MLIHFSPFFFLFLSVYLVSCMKYNMTGGGKQRKTNKKIRRTKPFPHCAFFCNLQGKFLRSESHLWGFSASSLLSRGYCTSAHTDPPQRSELSAKRLLSFPPSSQEGMQCTEQCLYYCWREGFWPEDVASPGFLMNRVLTGLVVNCYRCAPDSLMRRRKFRRPKNLFGFSAVVVELKLLALYLASPSEGCASCP